MTTMQHTWRSFVFFLLFWIAFLALSFPAYHYIWYGTVIRYKFDDERVTKEDNKRALEEQYGGEEEVIALFPLPSHFILFTSCLLLIDPLVLQQLPQTNPGFNNPPFKFTKYSNAYMLVYIRESDKDKIICNVDEKDIAEHLRVSIHLIYF